MVGVVVMVGAATKSGGGLKCLISVPKWTPNVTSSMLSDAVIAASEKRRDFFIIIIPRNTVMAVLQRPLNFVTILI